TRGVGASPQGVETLDDGAAAVRARGRDSLGGTKVAHPEVRQAGVAKGLERIVRNAEVRRAAEAQGPIDGDVAGQGGAPAELLRDDAADARRLLSRGADIADRGVAGQG